MAEITHIDAWMGPNGKPNISLWIGRRSDVLSMHTASPEDGPGAVSFDLSADVAGGLADWLRLAREGDCYAWWPVFL